MTNRQFDPVPLVCPNCGHILGQQAYFQTFEAKAAAWLDGEIAYTSNPDFDVWNCKPFPHLTFQVKYATAYRNHPIYKKYPQVSWSWHIKHKRDLFPDFFLLFGIDESKQEHLFLLSHKEFFDYATFMQGQFHLRVSAKLKSDRPNYNYVPKIWSFVVMNPEGNLIAALESKISNAAVPRELPGLDSP